jgi:activating signal cointegrator complex subunit 3
VLFNKRNHPEVMELELTIPAFEPLPPQYYLRIVSDQFVGCENVLPVSFKHVMLPARHLPYTDLADLTPLPTTALSNPLFESLYVRKVTGTLLHHLTPLCARRYESKFETFNPIQTQLFHVLYYTNKSLLLGAPTGSGKTIVAELAILRMKNLNPAKKAVYVRACERTETDRFDDDI